MAARRGSHKDEILSNRGGNPSRLEIGDGVTDGNSLPSSQLQSDTACSKEGIPDWGVALTIDTNPSKDGSYFILDDAGLPVLDNQGSPARAKKWLPSNANQRERYKRLHLATKGPKATCRWLPSVLVSPDHLKVPRAKTAKNNAHAKKNGIHAIATAGDFQQKFNDIHSFRNYVKDIEIIGAGRQREIEEDKKRRRFLLAEKKRERPKQLGGFMLMDACGCELPDEGRWADVSGRGLVGVVQEDLSYFIRLQKVDAGDNSLPFESFACLPQLEELHFPCNGIREFLLENASYIKLRRLDLSYNSLTGEALSDLVRLPNLIDLDLTCNGLTDLPEDMGRFQQLQKLSLERNQLESDGVFSVLSQLPALRELNLAFNYFTRVNFAPKFAEHAFPLLEGLDLGFNYISSEDDVVVLVFLERLQRIILYGNPLTGPTGEDSSGLCVEGIVDKAYRVREVRGSYPIEIITEMPRKRNTGGGEHRRRPYSGIGVTMVDEGYIPPATAFHAAGNESIFRFESLESEGPENPEAIVQVTLRSAKERCRKRTKAKRSGEEDLTFLTGVERQDEMADEGQNNEQLMADEKREDEPLMADGLEENSISGRLLRRSVDPLIHGDPAKLRIAFTALRYMLKHPVTSSLDVSWQHRESQETMTTDTKDTGIGRKTAAARARQLPRRPYRLLKAPQDFSVGLLDAPFKGPDLGRVDQVLTSMGAGMSDMALEKRPNQETACPGGGIQLSSIIRTVNAVMDDNEY